MRGHHHCPSSPLRITFISRAGRLCLLGRFAPRPAPRAVGRCVISPSRLSCRWARRHASFSPCVSFLATFSRYGGRGAVGACACGVGACRSRVLLMRYYLASASCLLPPSSPSSWLLVSPPAPTPLSPPIAPPIVSNKRGDIALLAYRCHVVRCCCVWLLFLSLIRGVSAFLALCRSYLKTFPVNLLKLSSAMF